MDRPCRRFLSSLGKCEGQGMRRAGNAKGSGTETVPDPSHFLPRISWPCRVSETLIPPGPVFGEQTTTLSAGRRLLLLVRFILFQEVEPFLDIQVRLRMHVQDRLLARGADLAFDLGGVQEL